MNKILTYITTIILFGILSSNNMKIGYIDSNRIMNELDEVREVQVELEKEQSKILKIVTLVVVITSCTVNPCFPQ